MPTSESAANPLAKPAKAITLNFDPRYIEFLVQALVASEFSPVHLDGLIAHGPLVPFRTSIDHAPAGG